MSRKIGIAAMSWLAVLPLAADPAPPAIQRFSRYLPAYFSQVENFVAREEIRQELMDPKSGGIGRRRNLVSDYQISSLLEAPGTPWEYRFVVEVDGKNRPEAVREIADINALRHANAAEERKSVVALAMDKSLPGCYWHNLTLSLLAFENDVVSDFDWKPVEDHFEFEQVRGLGIPENYFDRKSPRYYPKGRLWLAHDGLSATRLELQYDGDLRSVRMTLEFDSPAEGMPELPHHYEVRTYRLSASGRELQPSATVGALQRMVTGGELECSSTYDYSNYRRFDVQTDIQTGAPDR